MERRSDNRADIRDFLARRRAQLAPEQVGLPTSGRRRGPGLRREEVAVLAGVSTEWYTRLEKGHISGVSEDVLDAVARTLQLSEDERTYLFDLAKAAQPTRPAARRRRKAVDVPPRVQWLLDSMTLSAAFVSNGRLDIVATNALARALFAPMFGSGTTDERGRPNFARYYFLDPASHDFVDDWDSAADTTAALLRAEAGRYPNDKALRELVGELSTLSAEFRTRWAAHNVRIHHGGVKRFQHPDAGPLELTYQPLDLPMSAHEAHSLTIYTAEPGTTDEDRLKLLASWTATRFRETGSTGDRDL
ncbi:transcriptional regulator with XRE-family HTH domain [Spinactinospora alkalitolerans]|uniref:Transcriptional regulator with XRE-family HTH domain n=1 Tax=Spinactinospora alkalitolerans TaxID=687207 RepID=A0A852U7R3_9ACTN|nr:helix-turn-helix transcriptional regulator [Spinactinospora alkalitolerans]NYE50104.1 transcriptional regulator with XRE-family HTH domain [Spinactinospora alkalitolerans]